MYPFQDSLSSRSSYGLVKATIKVFIAFLSSVLRKLFPLQSLGLWSQYFSSHFFQSDHVFPFHLRGLCKSVLLGILLNQLCFGVYLSVDFFPLGEPFFLCFLSLSADPRSFLHACQEHSKDPSTGVPYTFWWYVSLTYLVECLCLPPMHPAS